MALRIKKLENDATSNIRTKRQRKLDEQVLEFEGISTPTVVSLGYTLNPAWTDITDAKLVCEFFSRREWTISLLLNKQIPIFPIQSEHFEEGPRIRSNRENNSGEETA